MTYCEKDYKEYLEKLEEFKGINWINNHLQLMKKPNFWSILEYGEKSKSNERSAHEIRSSKMLRWLLDANENHNLGNIFAHKLMKLIGEDYALQPLKNKAIKTTSEEKDIDVLYKDLSQNICIVIELKQFAKEGASTGYASQLNKYEDLVKENIIQHNPNIRPHYIYLTPLKDEPSNSNWHAVSYHQLINIIEQILNETLVASTEQYAADTKKVISDFKEDLQRTVDYLQKDHSYIRETLTDKEKELTLTLAEEIQHETDSKYLNELLAYQQNEDEDLQNLVLIIKDYTKAQLQNHNPNDAVRILIRKIYNYFSEGKDLETDDLKSYKVGETLSPITEELIHKYQLQFDKIELTSGKGQGLYLNQKDKKYRIYLSGDASGKFPNDGIQLLTYDNVKVVPVSKNDETKGTKKVKEIIQTSKHVQKNQFCVKIEQIINNKIGCKADGEIDFETLVKDHLIPAIEELNQLVDDEVKL